MGTQAGSLSSKQHCLFLPFPGLPLRRLTGLCHTVPNSDYLLNASHAYDSGLLPGDGSVPVKNTHARTLAQMHDLLHHNSQRPNTPVHTDARFCHDTAHMRCVVSVVSRNIDAVCDLIYSVNVSRLNYSIKVKF